MAKVYRFGDGFGSIKFPSMHPLGSPSDERKAGFTIGLVHEGDSIAIDAHKLLIQLNVPDEEIARRRAAWTAPKPRYTRGVLAKFATLASTASKGAVTD